MSKRATQLVMLGMALSCVGCPDEAPEPADEAETAPSPGEAKPALARSASERLDVLELLDTCDVSHKGHDIDVGSVAAETQRTFSQAFEKDVVPVQHGAESFAEILSRSVDYEFWLSEPLEQLYVSARVRGRRSGRMAVYIDNKRLGSGRLKPGEARVVSFKLSNTELAQGRHRLGIRLSRGNRHAEGPYAEIEWVRLSPDDANDQYAAPTLKDMVADVVLQNRPRRAIALRTRSSVRCPIWPATDAHLKLWLGFWGKGSGHAEIRVLRQGQPPVSLEQRELKGGDTAGWSQLDIPLGRFAGELVGLEFAVSEASGVGRVAFGEPTLTRGTDQPSRVPQAKTVILTVLSGLRRVSLPPWGSAAKLPAFGEFVRAGTAFTNYRAPSTVPAAALASMLSGMAPRAHSLEDQAARLPKTVLTINEALKQASGHAAMFTGVPTSFPAFGFDGFWDEQAALSPVTDEPAHAPFDLASAWIKKDLERAPDAKRFVLIHARGAHPPWDIPKDEAAKLKPEEYDGAIDPRRGAIAIAHVRGRTRRSSRRLDADDWTRLRELETVALKKQDAALSSLVTNLRRLGIWETTLLIIVGDVGAGEPPDVPYDPAGPLAEARLHVPLLVKFPGRHLAGKEVAVPTTAVDIAATVFEALRLEKPKAVEGRDLFALASGDLPIAGRPRWATLGTKFATRIGHWRLFGRLGDEPQLCNLAVDPACVNDVFASQGLIGNSLWKWTYLAEKRARDQQSVTREPASIDKDTTAALAVWGDLQ